MNTEQKQKKKKKRPFNWKNFSLRVLRRASRKAPNREEARKEAWRARGLYACAHCEKEFGKVEKAWFKQGEFDYDHIDPVVEIEGYHSLDLFAKRLFLNKIQVLCKFHHKEKTAKERELRKEAREEAKRSKRNWRKKKKSEY